MTCQNDTLAITHPLLDLEERLLLLMSRLGSFALLASDRLNVKEAEIRLPDQYLQMEREKSY